MDLKNGNLETLIRLMAVPREERSPELQKEINRRIITLEDNAYNEDVEKAREALGEFDRLAEKMYRSALKYETKDPPRFDVLFELSKDLAPSVVYGTEEIMSGKINYFNRCLLDGKTADDVFKKGREAEYLAAYDADGTEHFLCSVCMTILDTFKRPFNTMPKICPICGCKIISHETEKGE